MNRVFRFMDWPLRAKMAALLVVASLLPLGIETFVNIHEARERLLANTADLLAARGDQLLAQLDTFHRGYQRSLDGVARLPRVRDFYEAGPEDRDRLQGLARDALEVWPASDPNIRGVALLDLTGTVQLATEDPLSGMNLAYRNEVQAALRGVAVVSNIHLAEPKAGEAPTIAYLAPVFGPERKLLGVVAFWVRATALWEIMKASNELAGPQSFAVLFDQLGIRIGHTYREEIIFHPGGWLDSALIEALVAERRFGEKTRALLEDVRSFPEQFDRARAESPNRNLFRGFAPVNQKWNYGVARRFETVPWTIFYMIPEQTLQAQIAQMAWQKIFFAAAITFIALFAAAWFATAILKPIDSLAAATRSLAGGDLAARVKAKHADELGRLGASFNSMAARIQAQAMDLLKGREELELRVQERTAELEKTNRNMEIEITERKQAELVSMRLAAIVECSFDAIIGTDLHSVVTSWNAGAERMYGYAADEMIGHSVKQLIPPDRQDDEEKFLFQIKRGESVEHFETVRARKDGGLIDVSVTVSPIKDSAGEIVGASKVARDITDKKRAEAALRESEDQFRTMANSIPQLAWMAHADGFIFWYNQRWHDYTGTIPEQMEGWGWQGVHDPDVLPKVLEGWREAIATGQPFEMEFPLRGADGKFRRFLTRGQPLQDAQGRAMQWFGTCTDVDELKRVEESLRDTQARLNSTLAAGSIGTWTWDIVNNRLVADEFTARMFSIEADAAAEGLPAEAYMRAVIEEDQPGVAAALAHAIQSCSRYDTEYRVRQKDGELRWLQARGRVEGDRTGNAVSFHGAVMDVTDRKRADAALREVEEEKQLAFEASRLKSEFLANMSHELRTPLNCIIGFTEFLVDEKPGPLNLKQKEYLMDVHNSSRHLLQLINDVLDLAKVESGKIDLNPETFPLAKAIEEICAVVKGIALKKNVSVQWAIAQGLGSVTLDPQKFKQVCYNLLANAVKFTDSGGRVEINASMHGDERFEVRVRDTGIGIKTEDLPRLFREFEQLESGNARRFEGTGLGLALTKKLVESQGGSIRAESEYGKGSTFFVILPIILTEMKSHE